MVVVEVDLDRLQKVQQMAVQAVETQQIYQLVLQVEQEIHLLLVHHKDNLVELEQVLHIMMVALVVAEQPLQEKIHNLLLTQVFKHQTVEQERQLQLQQVQ